MKTLIRLILCSALVLALIPVGLVLADAAPVAPCVGDDVAGTVVAVDEATGVVTVDTGDGDLCTVTIASGTADHPVVDLLGRYFGDISADNLAAALEATETWVVCAADGDCTLAEEGDEDAVRGTVTGVTENADGSFTLTVTVAGEDEPLSVDTDDQDLAGELEDALAALAVAWNLAEGEDGPVVQDAAAEIEQLHDDGLGFGVIVKLYAMAAASQESCAADADDESGETEGEDTEADEPEACGVTVAELVEALEDGQGLGDLFKLYGKPALLGVGQVRKALQAEEQAASGSPDTTTINTPGKRCHAKKNGHGNPHCATQAAPTDTGSEAPATESTIQQPPGNAGGNHGNGNGNGGNGHGNGNGGNNGNGNGHGNGGGNNGNGHGNGGGNGGGRP